MELLSVILNFILGTGLLGTLLFYGSKRRKEKAEAGGAEVSLRRAELDLEHQSILFLQTQLSEAYHEIDKMQEIINVKRNEIIELINKTKEMEIALINTQADARRTVSLSCDDLSCPLRKTKE